MRLSLNLPVPLDFVTLFTCESILKSSLRRIDVAKLTANILPRHLHFSIHNQIMEFNDFIYTDEINVAHFTMKMLDDG